MSKEKPSKLDQFAERLDEWFGVQKLTLDEVKKQLALDGCSVSVSRLSDWWSARLKHRQEQALLGQIASGARQVKEVERMFAGSPAPELETLIKLTRVLILKLSTEGNLETDKLDLVNRMLREVQKFARLEQLGEQNKLEERKLALMERKAEMADQAKDIMENKELSEADRTARMREVFGIG